ncbi:MAG: hypothetical protein IPL53_00390 [Ignavibacteria bacterium]|nr:hypothetical protein [Ignavibacteria bacterium]
MIYFINMKNSAVSILSTFTREEINSFGHFLNSPFHNKNNKVILFFELLKKFHPGYDNTELSTENLFTALYGNEAFKESYIRNLFSDLKILAEKFLIHSNVSKSPGSSKILMEELHDRELTGLLNKKIEAFEKEIEKKKLKDQEYYSNKLFAYEIKSFLTVDMTLTDSFRKDHISSLIKFFLISILETSFHLIIEEQRVKIKHDFTFLKHILKYVKNNLDKFQDVPLLMIFYYLWMGFLEDDSEINFGKARKIFKQHFDTLTQIDKRNIYSVMQAYYDNKIKEGETKYNRELLNLLLEMLEFNVLSHNRKNSIHLNLYRNILILCFKLNEKEKLKKFVAGYLKFVRSESRSSISAYSLAHINFLEGNFEDALMQCNKINFSNLLITTNENLYFKIDVRTLILKSLFELNSIENAISHLQTFRHFLINSKIIKEATRQKYMNFLKTVNEMISLKIKFDEFKLMNLKKQVMTSKDLPGAEWVMEKLGSLIK